MCHLYAKCSIVAGELGKQLMKLVKVFRVEPQNRLGAVYEKSITK